MATKSSMIQIESSQDIDYALKHSIDQSNYEGVNINIDAFLILEGDGAAKQKMLEHLVEKMNEDKLWDKVGIKLLNSGLEDSHLNYLATELPKAEGKYTAFSIENNPHNRRGSPSSFSQDSADSFLTALEGGRNIGFPLDGFVSDEKKKSFLNDNPNADYIMQKVFIDSFTQKHSVDKSMSISDIQAGLRKEMLEISSDDFSRISSMTAALEYLSNDYSMSVLDAAKQQGGVSVDQECYKYLLNNIAQIETQRGQPQPEAENERVTKYHERFGSHKNREKPDNTAEQEAAKVAAEALYARAVASVVDSGNASFSALQRALEIGGNKAKDLLDRMEKEGIVSAPSEDLLKIRTVLVEKDKPMVDDVNEEEVVVENNAEESNKPVGSEIGDDAFWESPASEGFDKALYLFDKDLYAKVKDAYSEYKKSNEGNEAEGNEAEGEEKPAALVVEENDAPLVANEGEDNGWVEKYDAFLKENAEENGKTWERAESPEGTLKGSMGEDLDLSFAAESKVSFAMKKDKVPTADSFKELVALSKKEDMDLDISAVTRPESRNAIIEAAAKGGVEIDGLSNEEQDFYKSFLTTEEKTEEKTEENAVSYLSPDRAANINLRKFDRLAQNPSKDVQDEFEAVLARYEGAGAKIGGDDKESELYTLASYAKAFRAAEKSPENEALAGDANALEMALSKYGVAIDKQVGTDGVELGVVASSGKYDVANVAAAVEHIGDRSMSEFAKKDKYKSSPDAEQVMARRGEFARVN